MDRLFEMSHLKNVKIRVSHDLDTLLQVNKRMSSHLREGR